MRYKYLTASILSLAISGFYPIMAQAEYHSGSSNGVRSSECQKCHMMTKEQFQQKHQKWQQKLNLTDEQKQQFKAIRSERKAMMKSLREKKRALRKEVNTLAKMKEVDQEKVNALLEQYKALCAEKFKIKFDSKHKMYNILTDEQKQKISDMKKNGAESNGHN
jgi:periplasmic protein CpxP/Spy